MILIKTEFFFSSIMSVTSRDLDLPSQLQEKKGFNRPVWVNFRDGNKRTNRTLSVQGSTINVRL